MPYPLAFLSALLLWANAMGGRSQDLTPAELLRRVDSACMNVAAARYHAHYIIKNEGQEAIEREGGVSFIREKTSDHIGAKVRIDGSDGSTYASDGVHTSIILSKERRYIFGDTSSNAIQAIMGGQYSYLFQKNIVLGDPLSPILNVAVDMALSGHVDVQKRDCIRLTYGLPDDETFKQFRVEIDIDANDYLPRRIMISSLVDEKRNVNDLTISNYAPVPLLPDSLFTLSPPHGYELVRHTPPRPPEFIATGTSAPQWTLPDGAGHPHPLNGYRGSIVVMDFWYTTCSPCLQSIPILQRLHERFARKGVHVLGINCFDPPAIDPVRFLERRNAHYETLLHGDSVATLYRVTHFPTLYIVGRDGEIVHAEAGYSEDMEERLSGMIETILSSDKGK